MRKKTIAITLMLLVNGLAIGCILGPESTPIPVVRQILPVGTDVGQFLEQANPKTCEGCNLAEADLSDMNLEGAFLFGVNLYGANLSGAEISFSNLRYANLSGANLAGAGIVANLKGADLTGANASGTSFDASTSPDFTGVLNLLDRYHEWKDKPVTTMWEGSGPK